jgi:hypothetical protein
VSTRPADRPGDLLDRSTRALWVGLLLILALLVAVDTWSWHPMDLLIHSTLLAVYASWGHQRRSLLRIGWQQGQYDTVHAAGEALQRGMGFHQWYVAEFERATGVVVDGGGE